MIAHIRQGHSDEKYALVTAAGTVLASDMLVSTICDEQVETGAKLLEVIPDWQERHAYQVIMS